MTTLAHPKNSRSKIFSAALCLCIFPAANAQFAAVVPEGVLAVVGAHRTYAEQNNTWNANGQRVSLSSKSQLNFDGQHLLRGEGGAKLQSLAEELKRYDPNPNNASSLLKRLNLGTLDVGGRAKLNVQYLGFALGLPRQTSFYFAAPIIDLQITTRFTLSGGNNATAIRDELGGLAYDELRDGLDKASQLTERDIKASIEAAEYTGVDSWRYRNFADSIAGFAFDIIPPASAPAPADFSLQGEAFVSIPTGHVDNPDILSDVGVGTGAWGVGVGLTPALKTEALDLSLEANATYYLPSKQIMRIPEQDETIIPASRRTNVTVQTGLDWGITAALEKKFDWFQPQYRLTFKRHERDTLRGSLPGNYSALMNPTERSQYEHAVWLNLSTIELYKQQKFPLPLRFKLAGNQIFKGNNSYDDTFFELQLVSFLPTPWMPE